VEPNHWWVRWRRDCGMAAPTAGPVPGRAISSAVTRYADSARLDLRARLDLFLGVADAVPSRIKSPGLAPAPANGIRSPDLTDRETVATQACEVPRIARLLRMVSASTDDRVAQGSQLTSPSPSHAPVPLDGNLPSALPAPAVTDPPPRGSGWGRRRVEHDPGEGARQGLHRLADGSGTLPLVR